VNPNERRHRIYNFDFEIGSGNSVMNTFMERRLFSIV
jgi:hypothetical protein